uniref:Cytosolic Fe-S cluster assembly factor NUBP1 homolog n=1 Tax=Rhodosorus marinus TaxID=101924 RepID=A0A7S2ZXS9_9RHOD|mmetsp:Transcript_34404/g.135267  ORF Transcript_34404/g.135267 Transcript_34404/m.135267 type:complete len:320 (+) Transcript_34404:58-1017(+)
MGDIVPEHAPEGCPGTGSEQAGKSDSCAGCPSQTACASGEAAKEDPDLEVIRNRLSSSRVNNKILVLSGKGGVGKSTFASFLALALSAQEEMPETGLLDVDICGPSIPHMLSVQGEEVRQSNSGWQPVAVNDNLSVMSVAFLLPGRDNAVAWRGVRKTSLIKQFLKDTDWGELDYLIFDTPPGTSDEHISLLQMLKGCSIDGAVIVTTPQEVSLLDVRKEINFCRMANTPIIGVVENMSGFVCPSCENCVNIFPPSTGGAEAMCKEMGVKFLGKVPLDPKLSAIVDKGKNPFEEARDSAAVKALNGIVHTLQTILKNEN